MNNISRIEQRHTKGWHVRVWHNRRETSRFFADKKNGGKQKALKRAILERDELIRWREGLVGAGRTYASRFYYPEARNRSTGVVGVYRTFKRTQKGRVVPYYQATAQVEKGRPVTRAFNIAHYGEAEVFLEACEFRRDMLQGVYGRRFDQERFDRSVQEYLEMINELEIELG